MRRPSLATLLGCLLVLALPAAAALAQDPATTTPTAEQGADHKGAIVLLVVVGALLIAGALAWAFARWWAYEPPWLLRARHASGEAGWRTSATWAEFRDWVRLGR